MMFCAHFCIVGLQGDLSYTDAADRFAPSFKGDPCGSVWQEEVDTYTSDVHAHVYTHVHTDTHTRAHTHTH